MVKSVQQEKPDNLSVATIYVFSTFYPKHDDLFVFMWAKRANEIFHKEKHF